MRQLYSLALVLCAACAGDDVEPTCGDLTCDADYGENNQTCARDCPQIGGGPVCGDAVCNGVETYASCAQDCPPPNPVCTTSPDNCTGNNICISGACVAAFPRVYQFTTVTVTVPTTNPNNGLSWDAGGGAPDLYIGDAAGAPITVTGHDQFGVTFPGPIEVSVIAGGSVALYVWDEDISSNDFAFGCQANPITAALLRGREFDCTVNGAVMMSSINPK